MTKAIVIGAPRSGSGKTSVTIGLLRAFARRGLRVRGIKSGPDYIDPGFHAAATGRSGLNLDSWAMHPDLLAGLAAEATEDCDLIIIESAMGLFDGIAAEPGRSGAASDIACLLSLNVLLVLDISGQSQTAAAIAKGFAVYDDSVKIAGVVLNKVASPRHETLCADAIRRTGLTVAGAIRRDDAVLLPERHLGLVQASENPALDAHIDRLADLIENAVDLDTVLSLASPFNPQRGRLDLAIDPPGQRIALAKDAAFTFLYPHLEKHWRDRGAEILPFSPLANEAPNASCDICWLPGGYPELHVSQLAAADRFQAGMHSFAAKNPVHGECGGFMVLGEAIEDVSGVMHPMLGLLSHATSFAKRKMNLGYRQARLLDDHAFGKAGTVLRGHEFHYARVIEAGHDIALAQLADGLGNDLGPSGARRGTVSGTFFHAIAKA
ncbi:cobyrinate a,c-diamide synthase [Limoniibacter endophyticus]|uniref:Hydrogenobyrinate a,c-diamide synthase n=1 Tax=Limoniibacter endophyticus TaxID=1565040 RepID=A0A8J3DKS1_9HYPH|nr:cobyrinate a,c-diamide synthase [Limoniibacter endophyticus]GHC78484.1 hydrogenobyrinate a,c-diamide synthase [Limoniibacter endophyticus]